MRFDVALDAFIADYKGYGRINSPHTEQAYREKILKHADDCDGRPVEKTGKADVKKTLRRWPNANTQLAAHSALISFYDWCCEEDVRTTNPARMVRRARRTQAKINRLTRDEVGQLLTWASSSDASLAERWTIYLGVCAGLRNQELCQATIADVSRPGWVHVERTAGKGQKERWVPVISELAPVIEEIIAVGPQEGTLIRARMSTGPELNVDWIAKPGEMSRNGMYRLVKRSGLKAGIYQPITPHTLRHAFGDFIAKYTGLRVAQALLGHASVETTAGTYVDRVSMDELQVAVSGFKFFKGVSLENDPQTPGGITNAR